MITTVMVEQHFETRDDTYAWIDRVGADGLSIEGQIVRSSNFTVVQDAEEAGYTVHAMFGEDATRYNAGDEPKPEDAASAPPKVEGADAADGYDPGDPEHLE